MLISVINYTQSPITFMGFCVGVCQNADISTDGVNFKRGVKCINANHGRALEYPDVTVAISGYSARVIRELYTSIVGVTRLQESTRYVNNEDFDYFIPPTIEHNVVIKESVYGSAMKKISEAYGTLIDCGVPKEDAANVLPLGMMTKVVLKINARAISNMADKRLCSRAYHEYRRLMNELKQALSSLDAEWRILCEKVFLSSCEKNGFCTEEFSCGRYPKRRPLIDFNEMLGDQSLSS